MSETMQETPAARPFSPWEIQRARGELAHNPELDAEIDAMADRYLAGELDHERLTG
ncbi:MAG: hypothetical protein LC808_44675 [Actinobacteria bacterium]|nr:hypothetical protein [Actinomycetota bacterium]